MSQREMVKVPDWIKVTDANVPAGTRYWRLFKVEYWDDQRSGGTHHIYTMNPYDSSKRIAVSNGQQTWEVPLDKPNNEPSSNFAMWGGNYYKAWMTGMPSDTIEGMHMPAKHHVSYLLWWEEATKVGGSSSSAPTQAAPVTPAPPVTAPAPSPAPSATKRRLTDVPDWVRITDADVPPGTEYWQLARVDYWDDQRSGGTHHIYTMSPYDANQRIVVSNGQQSWEVPLDKPNNEPSSNFAMWGGNYYKAYMKGLPSDSIEGLHMPAKHHVSYLLWWKRAIKEGSSGGGSQSPAPVVSPPPVTPTPAPEPPRQESSADFTGNMVQTFTNGGLTQLFGVVHDRNGQPVPGTRLRITWQDSNAANFFTTAGQYVRAETDASGWEFNLNTRPVANTWLVAVVDQNGNPLSENVTVRTDGHSNYGAVNVAKIRFVTNRAVQSQSGGYSPTPTPTQSAPVAQAAPREQIDLPSWLKITDAQVAPGTEYWRLKKVQYWDDQKSGGTHHIYTYSPHDPSAKIVVSNGQQEWKVPLDKPSNEPSSNFAMWGGNYYKAWMDGMPSDSIEGMHMPAKHHVSYLLWWEKTVAGGGSAPARRNTATQSGSSSYQSTPAPAAKPFQGEIIQTFQNRGLTQVFGVIHDRNGRPMKGVKVRLTWPNGQTYHAPAGNYVRNETDSSGWDFFLNSKPIGNTWYVAIVDEDGTLLSNDVAVKTDNHANRGAVNVAKIRFVATK